MSQNNKPPASPIADEGKTKLASAASSPAQPAETAVADEYARGWNDALRLASVDNRIFGFCPDVQKDRFDHLRMNTHSTENQGGRR